MSGHQPLPHKVDPRDVLALDALLSDEELLMRDTVRQFVNDRILPEVGEWFDRGVFPKEMAKEFGALGLLGHAPRRLRLRRHLGHRVRPGLSGARGR